MRITTRTALSRLNASSLPFVGMAATCLALTSGGAIAEGGLGGLVGHIGSTLGDNAVGNTVGSVGGAVTGVGNVLDGGTSDGSGGLGNGLGDAIGGGLGAVTGGAVNTVGAVLSGSTSGNGGSNGGSNGGTGGFNNNGTTGTSSGAVLGANARNGTGNFGSNCQPMGEGTFNSFAAVDASRTRIGQIQGVVLQGDTIVSARFVTDRGVFGVSRCITISGGSITPIGSSVVLPVSRTQLSQKLGG